MMIKNFLTALALLTAITANAQVTLPHQFQPGQPARAADVNANFQTLRQALNQGFGMFFSDPQTALSGQNSSVVSVSCPANTMLMSANCGCDNVNGTRNYGVLFACETVGNSALVGCFSDSGTFNPQLPVPRGNATAQCVGAFAVDGSPIPVTPFLGVAEVQTKSIADADELSAAADRLRQQEAEVYSRMVR